jgi:hypothetical protein
MMSWVLVGSEENFERFDRLCTTQNIVTYRTVPQLYELETWYISARAFDASQISTSVSASKEFCCIFFVTAQAWKRQLRVTMRRLVPGLGPGRKESQDSISGLWIIFVSIPTDAERLWSLSRSLCCGYVMFCTTWSVLKGFSQHEPKIFHHRTIDRFVEIQVYVIKSLYVLIYAGKCIRYCR